MSILRLLEYGEVLLNPWTPADAHPNKLLTWGSCWGCCWGCSCCYEFVNRDDWLLVVGVDVDGAKRGVFGVG